MITAEQARRMAISSKTRRMAISSKTQERIVNKELKIINKYIKQAVRRGKTFIFYETKFRNYKKDIIKKLQEVGYHVLDDHDSSIIKIDWSETK